MNVYDDYELTQRINNFLEKKYREYRKRNDPIPSPTSIRSLKVWKKPASASGTTTPDKHALRFAS